MRSACLLLVAAALTGAAAAQTAPAPAPKPASAQQQLQRLLALTEPGAQRRSLEAYLTRYPDSPDKAQIYTTLIDDATQLGDDRGVLTYNEKLEALDPDDLAQRIKTINLLLGSSD